MPRFAPVFAILATASLVLGACSTRHGSLLVVQVDSSQPLSVAKLSAEVTAGGRTVSFVVPVAAETIPPAFTFGVDLPEEVTGPVSVTLVAGEATVSGATTISPGARFDLSLTFFSDRNDLGLDLSEEDGQGVLDLLGVDLTPGPGCGNGTRTGLEGCDDGNNVSGDGCSATCVVEGAKLPTFASLGKNGDAWMAVTSNGIVFVKLAGDCSSSADVIYRVDGAGAVALSGIGPVGSQCGGSIVALGADLLFGGSTPTTTQIQVKPAASGILTLASFSSGKPWTSYAAADTTANHVFFSTNVDATGSQDLGGLTTGTYRVTNASSYQQFNPTECARLFYKQSGDRLLCAVGENVLSANGMSTAGATYSPLFSVASAGDAVADLAVDSVGTIYAACVGPGSSKQACLAGSVFAFNPSFGSTPVTFVDSGSAVRALAYDPNKNDLVLLVRTAATLIVKRVHL